MENTYAVLLANGCLVLFLAVCAIALNGILLWIMVKDQTNTFNKPAYKIDSALVCSHFCAGLLALPYIGIREVLYATQASEEQSIDFATVGAVLVNFIAAHRIMILPVALAERYIAFVRPHACNQLTSKRITISSIVLAALCLLLDMVQFMGVTVDVFYTFYFAVAICLPVFISTILVFVIFCEIKSDRSLRRVETEIPPNEDTVKRSRMRRNRRAKKFLFIALVVMAPPILCVLPWYILRITSFHCSGCYGSRTLFILNTFLLSLLLAETSVAPLTSIFKFPEYRQAVKRMFCRSLVL